MGPFNLNPWPQLTASIKSTDGLNNLGLDIGGFIIQIWPFFIDALCMQGPKIKKYC